MKGHGDAVPAPDPPKLAPDTIARTSIEAFLDRPGVRVRLIAGAPGSGKTTAVAQWVRTRREQTAWITVTSGATRAEICALMVRALAPRAATLARAFEATAKTELVFDGADGADFDGRALLCGLAAAAPPGFGFVYLVRAPSALELPEARVAQLEPGALAFDVDDVERLCAEHQLTTTAAERGRVVALTSGWAIAVAGAIRYAGVTGGSLESAFERWLAGSRAYLERLVNDALALADPTLADAFADLLYDARSPGDFTLPLLEQAGLFVAREGDRFRMNPVIATLRPLLGREVRRPPAIVHLFGRFRFAVNEREVVFSRRRDRQIVQFLALVPNGAASRSDLIAVFWPAADAATAARSLRSACTSIRRAFADCVGREHVAAYFRADGATIRLCADHVFSTAQRFTTHIELARSAEARGELDAAFAHWSAARGIHATPLLAGEPPTWWIAERQREYARLASEVAERVQALRNVEQHPGGAELSA